MSDDEGTTFDDSTVQDVIAMLKASGINDDDSVFRASDMSSDIEDPFASCHKRGADSSSDDDDDDNEKRGSARSVTVKASARKRADDVATEEKIRQVKKIIQAHTQAAARRPQVPAATMDQLRAEARMMVKPVAPRPTTEERRAASRAQLNRVQQRAAAAAAPSASTRMPVRLAPGPRASARATVAHNDITSLYR